MSGTLLWFWLAVAPTAAAKGPPPFTVTARPRTPIQAGRRAWYEIAIRNETDSDQIVDLGFVELTGYGFLGPEGLKGETHSTSDQNVGPPKCADWAAFVLIKPGALVTTLARLDTPWQVVGTQQLSLEFDLWRVVDLKSCREERSEVSTQLSVQVQSQ